MQKRLALVRSWLLACLAKRNSQTLLIWCRFYNKTPHLQAGSEIEKDLSLERCILSGIENQTEYIEVLKEQRETNEL